MGDFPNNFAGVFEDCDCDFDECVFSLDFDFDFDFDDDVCFDCDGAITGFGIGSNGQSHEFGFDCDFGGD